MKTKNCKVSKRMDVKINLKISGVIDVLDNVKLYLSSKII